MVHTLLSRGWRDWFNERLFRFSFSRRLKISWRLENHTLVHKFYEKRAAQEGAQ